MHPKTLRTWPRGRQALAIRAHNLFQNNFYPYFKNGRLELLASINAVGVYQ